MHILLVIATMLVGLAAAALAAYVAYRLRRGRHKSAARATALPPGVARAAQCLPEPPWRAVEPPAVDVHHHWHGVNAEDVAEIIRRQQGQ